MRKVDILVVEEKFPEMGKAGPAGLPRGEQGVKRSTENDAKASGFGLPREGHRPLRLKPDHVSGVWQQLGPLVAAVVAALVVSGCGGSRAVVETRGLLAGEELASPVVGKSGRVVRSVTTLGPGGRVVRETTTVE